LAEKKSPLWGGKRHKPRNKRGVATLSKIVKRGRKEEKGAKTWKGSPWREKGEKETLERVARGGGADCVVKN